MFFKTIRINYMFYDCVNLSEKRYKFWMWRIHVTGIPILQIVRHGDFLLTVHTM